jgi:ABC-type sugar transport system ATPase subunit/ribose/xylose/arabinose/galactoside ABC-type transport system permease subunit
MHGEARILMSDSPPVDNALCRLKDVSKRFEGVTALDDVTFDIQPGEIHAIVGENGAGKSTLMKIMAGIYVPDQGTLLVDGKPVSFASVVDAEQHGVVMIPQELELFPELTIAENLMMGRPLQRTAIGTFDARHTAREAADLLDRLGVRLDVRRKVKEISAANRQNVAIARALGRDARVLILDEPTASLTDRDATRIFGILRDLRKRGVGIVYVSHRLEEIYALADRITVMRDGAVVATTDPRATDHDELVRLMVGRPLSQFYARKRQPAGESVLAARGLSGDGFTDVTLELRAREVVGMWGLVGAGRTEFASALAGISPATSGEITVRGRPVALDDVPEAMAQGIALVPEERRSQGLVLDYSIEHNITLSKLADLSRFGYLSPRSERNLANEFRGKLGIRGADLAAPVVRLSGGNQQKVVVAKSLAIEPSVLLLDEPTRGIDVGAKAEIYRLIDDLVGQDKAVLLISSELQEVLAIADRVIVLSGGSISAEFAAGEATSEKCLEAALGSHARRQVTQKTAGEAGERWSDALARKVISRPEAPALAFLALLTAILSVSASGFFSAENLVSLAAQTAVVSLIACALNYVLLAGEIDISTGAILAACIFTTSWVADNWGGLLLPLAASIALGLALGMVNGFLVVRAGIPSIVATLGTMSMIRGVVLSLNDTISSVPPETRILGQGLNYLAPAVLVLVGALAHIWIALGTRWSRNIMALGGNQSAAKLVGINAARTRFIAFAAVGAVTGFAAVVYLGQLGAAGPTVGSGLELQVIAAAVIGGTSPMGGRGAILAPIIGALLIGMIYSALAFLAIPGTLQDLVFGAVILLAIAIDVPRRRLLKEA